MKINIITLGCSKNTVDSENLAGHLAAAGHIVYFDRRRNDCDVLIINTCGFIGDAKEQSINTVLQAIGWKNTRHSKLIVCGCLVERYKEDLRTEMPEVDAWFGTHEWAAIVSFVENVHLTDNEFSAKRRLSTPRHYAYLKIAEGCNRSCSYCTIPLIRGAHVSRPIDELVDEAKGLVANGVKEIIVISQDTTYYGMDLYHRRALGEMLERLANESGAEWIRLHYTYPTSFPIDAIDVMRCHSNICNYIDIPLQHINSRLLSSMQRGIDREGTLQLLSRMRQQLPDVAIRTTLIVGYPGETEAEFDELKRFVEEARFDRMGCFAYSPEEGTPAYALGDPVSDDEKQRRVSELMAIQERISLEKNEERVGKVFRCLIDRREGDYLVGRTEYDSPEVDDEVLVKGGHAHVGDFVQVRIIQALENDLIGGML